MDFNIEPELLAAYAEAIGELPQFPTTCFSSSPIVIPMWAHYAQNHQGFVIEFSEEELERQLPECRIGNVEYSDQPIDDFSDLIARVVHIGKPRYTYMLRNSIFKAAYFTKTSCWSYEQERRLIVPENKIRIQGDMMLLDLPSTAIKNIICGARASAETKEKLRSITEESGFGYYELQVGRTRSVPYLVDCNGQSCNFDGSDIIPSENWCAECFEPIGPEQEKCSWCQIDDDMRSYAASKNPYRILHHIGVLDEYIREMDSITRDGQKNRIKDK